MSNKKNRKRLTGWAWTKKYPHENHPATYHRKGSNEIEYITFTHSKEVDFGKKGKVHTIPLSDNISPLEREKNKRHGKMHGENRSYVYPKVYDGKRSALGKETDEFNPVDSDKEYIKKMFEVFPREQVPLTGGKGKYRKKRSKQ